MAEARKSGQHRHTNQGGSRIEVRRVVGELWWTHLTACDVSASLGALICQIHARKIKGFVDDGPDVRIRCSEKDNYKYKNKSKITFLNGQWPENSHELRSGSMIQVQVHRHSHRHVMARKSR